jgi:hypothetical protein
MQMQKLKPSHTPEGVRRLRLGECIYYDNVVLPQDYGWIWRSIFGNPITDVLADELSGKAEFYLATNQDNQSGASVATAIGLDFRLVVPVGVLLFGSNPAYSYGGSLYSNFGNCYTDAWTCLYVGRYTLDGKFGGAPVNTTFPLRAHSIDSGLGYDHAPGTDSKSLSGRINVDNNHGHALQV